MYNQIYYYFIYKKRANTTTCTLQVNDYYCLKEVTRQRPIKFPTIYCLVKHWLPL